MKRGIKRACYLLLIPASWGACEADTAAFPRFSSCPERPNCVSSKAPEGSAQWIAPLTFSRLQKGEISAIKETLAQALPAEIVDSDERYLHLLARSAFWGFPDDIEIELDDERGVLHLTSQSRYGYYDFGVNRARLEQIKRLLTEGSPTLAAEPQATGKPLNDQSGSTSSK